MKERESFSNPSSGELREQPSDKVDALMRENDNVRRYIRSKLALTGEKLTEATDSALVEVANRTVSEADEDGVRTDEEIEQIQDAFSSVVVQGALEEAGHDISAGPNPILDLDGSEMLPDLMDAIMAFQADGATLPTGEKIADLALDTVERGKWQHMKRVGDIDSTLSGGIYEHESTGERYVVKFYDDKDHARTELIANEIYAKAGIRAVRPELVEIDGRFGIAYPRIKGEGIPSAQNLETDKEFRGGFVVDAFLANWDVVGSFHEHIATDGDGKLLRTENGGSLTYRAEGGKKPLAEDDIPELLSMRDPQYSAGEIFHDITDENIIEQAREFVERVSDKDIEEIVDKSGLEGEEREKVLKALLGRRAFLVRLCGKAGEQERSAETQTSGRFGEVFQKLREQESLENKEALLCPRSEIICDRDHIEDQRIDVIDRHDLGIFELRLKQHHAQISFEDMKTKAGLPVEMDEIQFTSAQTGDKVKLASAYRFERDGVRVYAVPKGDNQHAAIGLIKIEIPHDMDPEVAERIVKQILEEDFGMGGALDEVDEQSEEAYKLARYSWSENDETDEPMLDEREEASKLERQEVCPGYSTYVMPGRHKEMMEQCGEDIRLIHTLRGDKPEAILGILAHGLLGSSERFSRGLQFEGQSTGVDFNTGGADYAFTRLSNVEMANHHPDIVVVVKPEVLDRTDWFAYDHDEYGATEPEAFSERLSPKELMRLYKEGRLDFHNNELMFRVGIAPEHIDVILVDKWSRKQIITYLKMRGIHTFGGRPIEDVIIEKGAYGKR